MARTQPKILVLSETDSSDFFWMSNGWASDVGLMDKAHQCVVDGKNPGEVIDLLRKAGFDVVIEGSKA